jgi:hypothetical protein
MFMLVVLRMTIGWHFYREGVDHHNDPGWSSAGFLRQAKGPFAEHYKAVLPDEFAWYKPEGAKTEPGKGAPAKGEAPALQDKDLQGDANVEAQPAWKQWADDVGQAWETHRQAFTQSNLISEEQEQRTKDLWAEYQDR